MCDRRTQVYDMTRCLIMSKLLNVKMSHCSWLNTCHSLRDCVIHALGYNPVVDWNMSLDVKCDSANNCRRQFYEKCTLHFDDGHLNKVI